MASATLTSDPARSHSAPDPNSISQITPSSKFEHKPTNLASQTSHEVP